MTIEELKAAGKSNEEIMGMVFKALYSSGETHAVFPEQTPEPNTDPKPNPEPEQTPAIEGNQTADLQKMILDQQKLINDLQQQIIEKSKEQTPEPNPEQNSIGEDARRFSDEALNKAMQQLNLLSENDKIDVNKQVEDNMVSHLGSLVGFKMNEGGK